jgi:hypothetical protein
MEAVEAATKEYEDTLQALADRYDAVYDSALNSVQGQYNLWDKAAKVTVTSVDKITNALGTQEKYWTDYNANLQNLAARTGDVEGLSDVIASFADGSAESVNAIAGMAKASDEDLAGMVKSWQTVQEQQELVAKSIADIAVDIEGETADIVSSFEAMIADMELSSEAEAAAKATVSAYSDSIEAGVAPVGRAIDRVLAEVRRLDGVSAGVNIRVTGGGDSRVTMAHGSHADGLAYVPFDNYLANVHKGEAILTKEQNEVWTMVPQLMKALSERGNVTDALGVSGSNSMTISIGDINVGVSGSGASGSGQFAEGLKDVIIETILEYVHDNERREY